jgi:hypothetical protein
MSAKAGGKNPAWTYWSGLLLIVLITSCVSCAPYRTFGIRTGGVAVLIPIFALVLAAIVVRLLLRIFNRDGSAKWTLMALLVMISLYPLSFGPACWWFPSPIFAGRSDICRAAQVYWPFGLAVKRGVPGAKWFVGWYGTLFGPRDLWVPASSYWWDDYRDGAEIMVSRP